MRTTEDTEFTEPKYFIMGDFKKIILLFSVFSDLSGKDLMEDKG